MDIHAVIPSQSVFLLGQDGDGVRIYIRAITGIDQAHSMIARRQRWAGVRLLSE